MSFFRESDHIRRHGLFRFLDVLAFRFYYALVSSRKDRQWEDETLRRLFAGLPVGSQVKSGQTTWTVVGMFESGGSAAETELWCDARMLQGAYRRGNSYQSVLVLLESPQTFDTLKDWLTSNPQAPQRC